MAVRTELLESAIPEELIKQLPYQDVTAEKPRADGFKLEVGRWDELPKRGALQDQRRQTLLSA